MDELHRTKVDHVCTIWTEAPPPLRAGLLFRTGRADETLTISGYTHLIEHLALATLDDTSEHQNGFVGGTVTGFFTMGQAQDVASFFATVCENLTSLPGDHLERAKQVLAAETAARSYNPPSNLLTNRYGAVGYGLVGSPQLGIRRATMEQLHEYGSQRFTRENAVLWLSGPPPANLCLRLPHGAKQPILPLEPIHSTLPRWFNDDSCGGIAVGTTVPRVSASSIFREIASKRLRKRLRTDQAVSYAPLVFYEPLNADTAHLVLHADSDKERRAELTKAFGEVYREFGEIEESEVEAARRQIRDRMTGALAPPLADRMVMEAQRAAMEWILGGEFESTERLLTMLLAVTANDVEEFVREMQATAMFALPSEADVSPEFGKPARLSTAPAVRGRVSLSVDAPIHTRRLVHGSEGVSLLWPNDIHWTIRYADLAAALYYKDGGMMLIGLDATTLRVEPTLWRGGQKISREIRERVPAHLVVDERTRPPDSIPKPTTTAWKRFAARLIKPLARI